MKYYLILCLLLTFGLANCSTTEPEPVVADEVEDLSKEDVNNFEDPNADFNILFVGNSLTFYNDLPKLVRDQAKEIGIKLGTRMIAKANYAIIDHWQDGEVQAKIQSKKYDYVIIQQGPSSQQEGYDMLVNDGKLYKDLCDKNDTELVYFMVWPSRQFYDTFDAVIANYTSAAEINDAILCPVGAVWKQHFDNTGDFSYYGPDQFHPSLLGSQIAAKVIVETLFGTDCKGDC